MGVPDHLTCPLRNLYAGQKVTELELDMEQWNNFKIGKGVWQGCILSPCLFNLYAKYYLFGVAQLCLTLCDPVICSPPGFSVHGIFSQEYWSGLPFTSPGDLPNPGIKPGSSALQADSLPSEPPGKPICKIHHVKCWAGWITNCNQDCREKYQQPQLCRWCYPDGI